MKKICSITAVSLAGIIGTFVPILSLEAAEPEPSPAKATAEIAGNATPRIQFETNFYDFGKITAVDTVSGVFKFKNVGDGVLKVSPPETSCGCTDANVKPETLAPGEQGELAYTIKLEQGMKGVDKRIRVHSNDPQNPDVTLTMHVDYTPLYELSPMLLRVMLPAGKDDVQAHFTVTRTDGKPLGLQRLTAAPEWVSAAFDPAFKPEDASARVIVTVRRPARPPALIAANVQMWDTNQAGRPVKSLVVVGEFQGELVASPSKLYWVIPDFGTNKADYPPESLTKEVELKSVLGKPVTLTNPVTSIKGLSVKLVPKDTGKTFGLVLTFNELPQAFLNGKVTVETSLASLPKLEVPVTVAVPNPN